MRKISTYLKSMELMENRNYTVELWRASKISPFVLAQSSAFRLVSDIRRTLKKLHLNQDGIKHCRVAQVGEFFRSQYIYIQISGCKFCPVQFRRDYSRRNFAVHPSFQLDFAATVEHPHRIAVVDAAAFGILPADFQQSSFFHRLHTGQIRERGVEKIVRLTS